MWVEDVVHDYLEGNWCIGEAKWHDNIVLLVGVKHCLDDIFFSH